MPPNNSQKKKLLAMVVAYGVKLVMSNHVYAVGDDFYLQTRGGPIGLELTGVVARVFMMHWDRQFLLMVREAGLLILWYKRYVDDTGLLAQRKAGMNDDQLIEKIVEIANSVDKSIKMEVDTCKKHSDSKLPMLDMKLWIDSDGYAVYEHFEKGVATKLVISSRSAHSSSCKRSVHISELVRRMQNTSRRLSWDSYVAPVLTDYMGRMAAAGYHEDYRKHVLLNAFAIFDNKLKRHMDGECPLNRPSGYRKIERRKEKIRKKKDWGTKGGYIAPIIVPATPDGELAKMLRSVAEKEKDSGIKFKIVEKGGLTIEKLFQTSNPTASGSCGKPDCMMDSQNGRNCHKSNVMYEWVCKDCPSSYIGETSRNFYTRSSEHLKKASDRKEDSFIHNHQIQSHNGNQPNFSVKVLKSFQDAFSRQVYEGVYIRRNKNNPLNTKLDYYQTSTYNMRREMLHG